MQKFKIIKKANFIYFALTKKLLPVNDALLTITKAKFNYGSEIGIALLWFSAFLTLITGYSYIKKGINHAID